MGRLNKILPKRQFILMGPGRWGSRGDVRLGVSVGYADISNTAMLIEIARKKGNYVPDLSFGTHFFQDLVESGIRYLPLYPDEAGNDFDEVFLRTAPNLLSELIPEYAHLSDVVHVIDVPAARGGLVLHVLMNGDLDEAVGLLSEAVERPETPPRVAGPLAPPRQHHVFTPRVLGGALAMAAGGRRAHRGACGRRTIRRSWHMALRKHQERHGPPRQRFGSARALRRR